MTFPGEMDLSWQDDAACAPVYADTWTDLWFEPDEDEAHRDDTAKAKKAKRDAKAAAKKICTGCPVRLECLTFAYENDERHGIWGGMDGRERTTLKNKLTAGKAA
jgi:WhiB family redox-sensing transcriptional regulator